MDGGGTHDVSSPGAERSAGEQAFTRRMKSGAAWFYWIAGLSLANTVLSITGSGWGFVVGTAVTQFFDAIAGLIGREQPGAALAARAAAVFLDILVAVVFVVLGYFAGKGKTWVFALGMVLYGLDALLSLLVQDWVGLAFHALALAFIGLGLRACRQLGVLERQKARGTVYAPIGPGSQG